MSATNRLVALAVIVGLSACSGGGGDAPSPAPVESKGTFDSNFGMQGVAIARGGPVSTTVREIVVVDDGYLVGGSGPYVTKLTREGLVDTSFALLGTDAVRRGTKFAQSVTRIASLPGGSIVVAETHNGGCSGPPPFCAQEVFGDVLARRTDARGNPDSGYGLQGVATLPYSEGAVVVSPLGRVTSFSLRPRLFMSNEFAVASLDPNGVRDPAFEARALEAVQQCGSRFTPPTAVVTLAGAASSGTQIVVASLWVRSDSVAFVCISRLNADGTLDAGFGNGGHQVFDDTFDFAFRTLRVVLRSDNGVIVTLGPAVNGGSLKPTNFFFLTANGAKDMSVLPQGWQSVMIGVVDLIHDVAIQDNDKILTVGQVSTNPGVPAFPLDPDTSRITRSFPYAGIYDAGFGPFRGGYTPLATAKGGLRAERVVVDRDGAILVGGQLASTFESAVVKLR